MRKLDVITKEKLENHITDYIGENWKVVKIENSYDTKIENNVLIPLLIIKVNWELKSGEIVLETITEVTIDLTIKNITKEHYNTLCSFNNIKIKG